MSFDVKRRNGVNRKVVNFTYDVPFFGQPSCDAASAAGYEGDPMKIGSDRRFSGHFQGTPPPPFHVEDVSGRLSRDGSRAKGHVHHVTDFGGFSCTFDSDWTAHRVATG
jgi:hypothetical protein